MLQIDMLLAESSRVEMLVLLLLRPLLVLLLLLLLLHPLPLHHHRNKLPHIALRWCRVSWDRHICCISRCHCGRNRGDWSLVD